MLGRYLVIPYNRQTGGAWSPAIFLGPAMENHLLHNLREKNRSIPEEEKQIIILLHEILVTF